MKQTAVKLAATILFGTILFLSCPTKYAQAAEVDKLFNNYTVWNMMTDDDSFPTDGDKSRYNTAIESGWHYLNLSKGSLSTAGLSVPSTANMQPYCGYDIDIESVLVISNQKTIFDSSYFTGNRYESLDRDVGLFIKFAGYDQDGEKRYYLRVNNNGTPGKALYIPAIYYELNQSCDRPMLALIATDEMKKRYVAFEYLDQRGSLPLNDTRDYGRIKNLQGDNLSVIAAAHMDAMPAGSSIFLGDYFPAESTDTWVFRKSNSSNGFNIRPAGSYWSLYNDVKDSNGKITLEPDRGIERTFLKNTNLSLSFANQNSESYVSYKNYINLDMQTATDFEVFIGDPWGSRTVKDSISVGQNGEGYDNFQIGNKNEVTFYAPSSKLEVKQTGVVSISGTVIMHGTMDIKGTVVVQPGAKLLIYGGDTSGNNTRGNSGAQSQITRDTNVYLEGDLIILEDAAVAFVSGTETTFEVQGNGSIYNHGLLWMGCSTLYLAEKSDFVNYGEFFAGLTPEYPDYQLLSADYDDGHLEEYARNFKRFYGSTAARISYYAKDGVPLGVRNRLYLHNRYDFANGKIVADGESSVENRGSMVLASNYLVYGKNAVGFGKQGPEFIASNYDFSLNIMDRNDKYTFNEAKRPLN